MKKKVKQYSGSWNGIPFSRKSRRHYTHAVVIIAAHERSNFETLEPCAPYLFQVHYCGRLGLALKQAQKHDLGFWERLVERHIVPVYMAPA